MLSKEQFTKRFAMKLRELRDRRGLSQEELADKTGVYRTYIGHIENGRYNPSAYMLYKLAAVLGVDLQEFFT